MCGCLKKNLYRQSESVITLTNSYNVDHEDSVCSPQPMSRKYTVIQIYGHNSTPSRLLLASSFKARYEDGTSSSWSTHSGSERTHVLGNVDHALCGNLHQAERRKSVHPQPAVEPAWRKSPFNLYTTQIKAQELSIAINQYVSRISLKI